MYDKNNIFNKIINKELNCNLIYESKHSISFYDINPKARIHALLLPKGNYIDIIDFTNNATLEEISDFFKSLKKVTKILNIEDGFKSVSNTQLAGGQEVFHYHMHILRD